MAFSYNETTGAGLTNILSVPFPYISQADVHVYVDGVEVSAPSLTWLSSSTVQLPLAASAYNGKKLLVQRATPYTIPAVSYVQGGLEAKDLNTSAKQELYALQEVRDAEDITRGLADRAIKVPVGQDSPPLDIDALAGAALGITPEGLFYKVPTNGVSVIHIANIVDSGATGKLLMAASTGDAALNALPVQWRGANKAALQAATLGVNIVRVAIDDYSTAGAGGGGVYAYSASEPAHLAKIQTANGRWYELVKDQPLDYTMFGAVPGSTGNGVTNSAACRAAISFASLKKVGAMFVKLGGDNNRYIIGDNATLDTCLLAQSGVAVMHEPGVGYIVRAKGRDLATYTAGGALTRLQSASLAAQHTLLQVNGVENGAITDFHWLGKPVIDGESNTTHPARAINMFGEVNRCTLTARGLNLASSLLIYGDYFEERLSKSADLRLSLDYSGIVNVGGAYEIVNLFPKGTQTGGGPGSKNTVFYDCDIDATAGDLMSDSGHAACAIKLNNCDGVRFEGTIRLRGGTVGCLAVGNGTRRLAGTLDCGDSPLGVVIGNGYNNITTAPTGYADLSIFMRASPGTGIVDANGRIQALRIQGDTPGMTARVSALAGGVDLRTSDFQRFAVSGVSVAAPKTFTISMAAYPAAAVVTETGHGRTVGCPIKPTTDGALPWMEFAPGTNPQPMVQGRSLYVRSVIDANNYTICSSPPALAISTAGLSQSGTHTFGGVACTISLANPAVITQVGHGRVSGSSAALATTGTLPSSLPAGTYVVRDVLSADTFTVVASLPTAISTTGSQSGTHTMNNTFGMVSPITTSGGAFGLIYGISDSLVAPSTGGFIALTRSGLTGTFTATHTFATQDNKITGTIGVVDDMDAIYGARVTGSIKSGWLNMSQPTVARSPVRGCHFDLVVDGLDTSGNFHDTLATCNTGGANWWMEKSYIKLAFVNPPASCVLGYGKGNRYNLWSRGNGTLSSGSAIFRDYGEDHVLEDVGYPAGQTRHHYLFERMSGSKRLTVLHATGPNNSRWHAGVAGQDVTRGPGPPLRADFLLSAAAANQVLAANAGQHNFVTGVEFIYPDGTTGDPGVALTVADTSLAAPSNHITITSPISQAAGTVVTLAQTDTAVNALLLNNVAALNGFLFAACAGGKTGADRVTMLVHVVPLSLAT